MVTIVGVIWPKTSCWFKNKKLEDTCVLSSSHTNNECRTIVHSRIRLDTILHFCWFKVIELPASFS